MDVAVIEVRISVPDPELAQVIATRLVVEHLVATVQVVGPVLNVFPWREEVQTNREYLLIGKTTSERFAALAQRVQELHTYDLPEIIGVPVPHVVREYADWIAAGVSQQARS